MSDEIEMSMAVPLDSDGFLRRQCPTCEREFKWKPAEDDDEGATAPDAGYFCPYCAVQAQPGSWWTEDQLAAAQKQAYDQVVKPQIEELESSAQRSGMIEVSVSEVDEPPALTERDDMRRVDFTCHQGEPVKVLEEWDRPVHCLLCGEPAEVGGSPGSPPQA